MPLLFLFTLATISPSHAFVIGEAIPALSRVIIGEFQSDWVDMGRQELPRFGESHKVAVFHDGIFGRGWSGGVGEVLKIQLSINGFVTPWLTVSDGKGAVLTSLGVHFFSRES